MEIEDLKIPDYNKEFILRTDASNIGLGAVLMQANKDDILKPIEWASKKLTDTEKRYGISEKEMYAVFWGIKRFEYELRGRKFILETDHKALEKLKEKPYFENNRINRWSEKIMEFDFEIRYVKGDEMGKADELNRNFDNKQVKSILKGKKIKESKWNKHVIEMDGSEYWKFDSGQVRKSPEIDERKRLCMQTHEEILHRGYEAVYQEMKKFYYWPGIKQTIIRCIKECEVCQINNRKKSNPPEYVVTTKPFEKVALDIMQLSKDNCYLMIGIDYFTRMVCADIIYDKKSLTICETLKLWFENGYISEEIISDNGKEFVNSDFREFINTMGIKHRKISVESHRSNGRIERVISTFRDYMQKYKDMEIKPKVQLITEMYNKTYHSSIKCTPCEALENYMDVDIQEKNRENKKMKIKIYKKEKYTRGEDVRVCQRDNIHKYEKGRFLREGKIVEECENGAWLIKMKDSGKIVKKRSNDIKKMKV